MFQIIRSYIRPTSFRNSQLIRFSYIKQRFNSTIHVAKEDESNCLTITKGCQSVKYHYFWLRDHCHCDACYNKMTAQRKVNILQIPWEIKPETLYVDSSEVLRVTWKGGHQSEYSLSWLEECLFENYKKRLTRNHKLWTGGEASCAPIANVSLKELLVSNTCLSQLINSLVQYGVAFVENVESIEGTEAFAKRIGPIKNTFFGQMWEFSDSLDHNDTAYTREGLEPHTDNTYLSEASGLLILHCLSHDGTGGENTLVDGFKAVSLLKEQFPDVFDRLKNTSVGAIYLEKGQHHLLHSPTILINTLTQDIEQIRFNEYDRAPVVLPFESIMQFYKDFGTLMKIIKNPDMIWKFKLKPGNAMIIDNFRLLHGRTAYVGKRKMCGCYIGRTDFLSKTMLYVNET